MEEDIKIHPTIYDLVQVVLELADFPMFSNEQIILIVFKQLIILFGLLFTSFQLRRGNWFYDGSWL